MPKTKGLELSLALELFATWHESDNRHVSNDGASFRMFDHPIARREGIIGVRRLRRFIRASWLRNREARPRGECCAYGLATGMQQTQPPFQDIPFALQTCEPTAKMLRGTVHSRLHPLARERTCIRVPLQQPGVGAEGFA